MEILLFKNKNPLNFFGAGNQIQSSVHVVCAWITSSFQIIFNFITWSLEQYMYMFIWVCVHAHASESRGLGLMKGVFLYCFHFLRQGLSQTWNLTNFTRLAGWIIRCRDPPVHLSSRAGIASATATVFFYMVLLVVQQMFCLLLPHLRPPVEL